MPVRTAPELRFEAGALSDVTPGGERITVSEIRLSGNRVFASDVLLAQLRDFKNKSYDLAGLRDLANTLTVFYREAGYSFAKVYVPQQEVGQDGGKVALIFQNVLLMLHNDRKHVFPSTKDFPLPFIRCVFAVAG